MPESATLFQEDLAGEALDNFAVLIDDLDFEREMNILGLGRMQIFRRRQMSVEFVGLYIALWRFALAHSFPADADVMFRVFLHRYLSAHQDKNARRSVERGREYWAMLEHSADADFRPVARHLVSFFQHDEKEARALSLKLALHIYSVYRFIFDRLI